MLQPNNFNSVTPNIFFGLPLIESTFKPSSAYDNMTLQILLYS